MTATTTTLGNPRLAATVGHARRAARGARSVLAAIGARWNDLVDSGQFGPSGDTVTSRHTGSRI